MAKKKPAKKIEAVESIMDTLIEESCEAVAGKFGVDSVHTGGQEESQAICLPLPSLSARMLFMQNGLPLSREIMLCGLPEACKSAFLAEMGRWFRLNKGGMVLCQTEFKDSSELRKSIMGYAPPVIDCKTQEDWSQALFSHVANLKAAMTGTKKKPGPGRIAPMLYGVDSRGGVVTNNYYDEIVREGTGAQHHPTQQKMLSDIEKVLPKEVKMWPFDFAYVHHLKPGADKNGFPTRNVGGGYGPRFHCSIEIEMIRRTPQKSEIIRVGEADEPVLRGILLEIHATKNSCAPHGSAEVEMLWYTDTTQEPDPVKGGYPQRTFFDWHAASVAMLSDRMQNTGKLSKLLKEVVDLNVNKNDRTAWSKTLGIPESDPVPYRLAGAVLESRKDVLDGLYPILGIRSRYQYAPGVDFLAQQSHIEAHIDKNPKARFEDIPATFSGFTPLSASPAPPAIDAEPANMSAAELDALLSTPTEATK